MGNMDFIVPGVFVDESDVGPRPIKELSLAAIGIVGTFDRGPVNEPVTIGDEIQLIKKFGNHRKGLTGILSTISAMRQGANDFRIVRIAGVGYAEAKMTISNGAGAPVDVLEIAANSPGAWGNNIKISVKKNAGDFDLTIKCGEAVEVFSGLKVAAVKEKVMSEFVTVKVTDEALTGDLLPKATTVDTGLTGGNDGAAVTDDDYIGAIDANTGVRTGLKTLEPLQIGIVVCAQQYSERIHKALQTFAENCDLEEGLRIGVLNSAPKLSADKAAEQTKSLQTDRGTFAYPWITSVDYPDEWIAPDGFLAGVISTVAPHESPSNKEVQGILKLERDYSYAEVKLLTQARICPITLKPNRGFRVRNGLTLSSDEAWAQIAIRRQQDRMNMELYFGMEWAISLPHEPKLWNLVAECADLYFQKQKNLGRILGFLPTLCNAQTNPPENIISRILTMILRWKPLYPADFIVQRWKRELPTVDE